MIKWVFDADFLHDGVGKCIQWQGKHTLISGQTGSGKTVALSLLLGKIALHMPESKLFLLDFKSEFEALSGAQRYFRYADCTIGMNAFEEAFDRRMTGADKERTSLILCIDEWAAFVGSSEKKVAEEHKRLFAKWLMLGRSLGVIVIVGVQRPDASASFPNGARDQFGCVFTLGNQSKEAVQMLYSDYKDEIQPVSQIGEGYMIQEGKFYHVQTPNIHNRDILVQAMRRIIGNNDLHQRGGGRSPQAEAGAAPP